MNTINVLILEDEQTQADALKSVLEKNNYSVIHASSYKDALNVFYNEKVDIIVIDVFLKGNPEGLTFAETISLAPNRSKPFVFLTSSSDRNVFERAKLTQPFSYLMKPFNELEILFALEVALEKFYNQPDVFLNEEEDTVVGDEFLYIKKGKSLKKVLIHDIIYIEVEEKYCNIITDKEKFVILISLKKILNMLEGDGFSRTHRNYIVNTSKIIEIVLSDNLVILEGNHKAVLSDRYKDIIKEAKVLR